MIVGMSSDSGFGLPYILRVDSAGSIIFSIRSYLLNDSVGGVFTDIIQTKDGNYVALGDMHGICLYKFDINGNGIWNHAINIDNCLGFQLDWPISVIETSDGGFAISGSAYKSPYRSMEILKTDSSGQPQWMKFYSIGQDMYAVDDDNLVQKNDSGFVAFEHVDSPSQMDAILVNTDKNGNLLNGSGMTLDSSNLNQLQAIYNLNGSIYLSFNNGFAKTNLDTNIFSFISFFDPVTDINIETINESSNSDLLVTFKEYNVIPNKTGAMRIDTSGNIIWKHGILADKLPKSLHELSDKTYLLDGISYDSINNYFIDVIKLDTNGNNSCFDDTTTFLTQSTLEKLSPYPVVVNSCQLSSISLNLVWHNVGSVTDFCFTTSTNEMNKKLLAVFPNPFYDKIHLSNTSKILKYKLYSMLGVIISEGQDIESTDFSNLSPGIFVLRLFDKENVIFLEKMFKY